MITETCDQLTAFQSTVGHHDGVLGLGVLLCRKEIRACPYTSVKKTHTEPGFPLLASVLGWGQTHRRLGTDESKKARSDRYILQGAQNAAMAAARGKNPGSHDYGVRYWKLCDTDTHGMTRKLWDFGCRCTERDCRTTHLWQQGEDGVWRLNVLRKSGTPASAVEPSQQWRFRTARYTITKPRTTHTVVHVLNLVISHTY
jgi:hypothetical protein